MASEFLTTAAAVRALLEPEDHNLVGALWLSSRPLDAEMRVVRSFFRSSIALNGLERGVPCTQNEGKNGKKEKKRSERRGNLFAFVCLSGKQTHLRRDIRGLCDTPHVIYDHLNICQRETVAVGRLEERGDPSAL